MLCLLHNLTVIKLLSWLQGKLNSFYELHPSQFCQALNIQFKANGMPQPFNVLFIFYCVIYDFYVNKFTSNAQL